GTAAEQRVEEGFVARELGGHNHVGTKNCCQVRPGATVSRTRRCLSAASLTSAAQSLLRLLDRKVGLRQRNLRLCEGLFGGRRHRWRLKPDHGLGAKRDRCCRAASALATA